MNSPPWIERTWEFDFPAGLYPSIVERLRGTPARIAELVEGLSPGVLVRTDGDTWSIQRNVGHLLDLEALPAARLDDFLAGKEVLTAADMSNRLTHEAGHDEASFGVLLAAFRRRRGELVERLEALEPADFERTALHPRLQTPMRLVDMCLFQADHDDHHLARISELKQR